MKNIVFITTSGSQGGAEKQLSYLLSSLLIESNVNIYLFILGRGDYLSNQLRDKSLFIYQSHFDRGLISRLLSIYHSFKAISYCLESLDFDCTILQGWLPLGNIITFFVKLFTHYPHRVIFSHRSSFFLYQSFLTQINLYLVLLISFLFRYSIFHVANSSTIFSPLLVRTLLSSRNRLVIHNGFPLFNKSIPSMPDISGLANLPKSSFKILKLIYVARFSPEKRHALLFKSLSNVTFPFKLTCIGLGCSHDNLSFSRLCSKYNLYPLAFECVPNISDFFVANDFSVLFSRTESFPNVLIESMMSSTPCISFDIGEASEIIGNSGILLPSNNFLAIVETLNNAYSILGTPYYYYLQDSAYRRSISSYSQSLMCQSYLLLYSDFLQ